MEDARVLRLLLVVLVEHVTWAHSVDALFTFVDWKCVVQVFAELEDFVKFCHLFQPISIQLASLGVVSGTRRFVLEAIQAQKLY